MAIDMTGADKFYKMYLEKTSALGVSPIDESEFNKQVEFVLSDYYVEDVFSHPEDVSPDDWELLLSLK